MGKLLRFVIGVVAFIVIVPLLLVGAFLVTFDFDAFKKDITAQASKTLGRDIALDGPIGVSFARGFALSVKDVSIGNPAGFKDKEFIKAGKVDIALNWQALSDNKIDITHFIVEDANINLVTNVAGESNWDIKMPKSAMVQAESVPANRPEQVTSMQATVNPKAGFEIKRFDLNSIDIIKTTLRQKDERTGKSQDLEIKKATVKAPYNAALNVGAEGSYNKTPFTIEFTAPGGVQQLSDGKPSQIDLKADYAGQSYALKGTYTRGAKVHDIKNLSAKLMGIDFTGNLKLNQDGDVPMMTGSLSAPEANLTSLSAAAPKTVQKKSPAVIQSLVMVNQQVANRIVASAPVPDFKALKAINADIALNIGKLIFAEGKSLDNLKTNVNLSGGRLKLDPISATFLNVAYKGSLDFNPASGTPVTRVVLSGNNIDFAALAAAFNSKSPLNANGDLDMDVTGQGMTPDSFKNSLSGKIQMVAGKGAVDMGSSGAAGLQLIKMLYPKSTATEKQNINCGAMRFIATNGVLRSNGLLFDSPIAAVAGEGTVDLGRNQANLLLRNAVKDQQAASFLNVPIKVTGPLSSLSFMPEEKAVAQRVMSAINGGGSSSSGVPKVDANAKGNGCLAAINDPNPPMIEQMKTQDAVKATVNQAKDVIKNIGKPSEAMDKLKGLFR